MLRELRTRYRRSRAAAGGLLLTFLPLLAPPAGALTTEPHISTGRFEPLFLLNRVQEYGFGGAWTLHHEDSFYPALGVRALYATGTETWYPDLFVEQPLVQGRVLHLWARYAKEAQWFGFDDHMVTQAENTLAALFLREDFPDYVEVRRIAGGLRLGPLEDQTLTLGIARERHRALRRTTQRAGLFGWDRDFSRNPAAVEMEPNVLTVRYDWRIPGGWTPWSEWSAWDDASLANHKDGVWLTWEGRWAHPDLGGELDVSRHLVEARVQATPARYLEIRARAAVGWTPHGNRNGSAFAVYPQDTAQAVAGRLPVQWTFHAGGLGTLRGHDDKEFLGDQLLLANLEYGLRPEKNFMVFLFTDLGKAWYQDAEPFAGHGFFARGRLEWDGGIGVELGDFRAQLGQNLRELDRDPRLTVRFERPF
ncbi:MAG: hypothetical protein GF355_13365 [Candidatus Eisenbacteria bacterium]|nr:hypothetical protein [Candidatus Eisenbacteria bacterium]